MSFRGVGAAQCAKLFVVGKLMKIELWHGMRREGIPEVA